MAAARLFEHVYVHVLNSDGDKRLKFDVPVTVSIGYDPHGLSCKISKDDNVEVEIPVDSKTECCKFGAKSYLFASHEDLLLTFSSASDARRFHEMVFKVRVGKEASVFNERTDDSSATQYFQFYSYLSQQQNMMQDYIRTGTYQQAILSNMTDFKDCIVLDVGAGSGILSFFAAQAGAKMVYAVEASSMAHHCQTLVKSNNLQNRIKVIAGKIEEVDLPCSVDIIISEPMGYMLYNERMLETYIHARKWLKPNGKMFPSRGDLHVAPFCDEGLYYEQLNKANFWYQNCFHGVDLSHLRDEALNEYLRQPIVDTFDISICLAKSVRHTLDFTTAAEEDLHHLEIPLEFHILKSSMMHGLAFWFDVAFLGSTQTVWLSTAPTEPLTHWYQVRCLLQKPVFVKEGQLVTGKVQLIANRRQSYDVKLAIQIEGTAVTGSNTLDLKNPYFRYTGAAPQPPPGNNTTSPSENYWHQVDEQGAKQALNMVNGITVNGLGEVALDQGASLITLGASSLQLAPTLNPVANLAGVRVGQQQQILQQQQRSVAAPAASTTVLNHHAVAPAAAYAPLQHLVNPVLRQTSSAGGGSFPVNSALMIGDYVTPGSILLPTQGLNMNPSAAAAVGHSPSSH